MPELVPTTDNIAQLVRAARHRTLIENEAPRTQGYHLEHNFGHGHQHLSEAFFTLNLLAFFLHQIFDLVDGLYQQVRTFFTPVDEVRLPAAFTRPAHELATGARRVDDPIYWRRDRGGDLRSYALCRVAAPPRPVRRLGPAVPLD